MENNETKALEISGLCKSYGDKKVLDNVSFSVDNGEIVGFLGPNGAGKSTTINIVTGYLSATKGQVKVCGIDILENPLAAKAKIGYLPEIPPLYQDLTVYEYLCFVFDLKKCTLDKEKHIAECMSLVKIMDVAHRMIKNLSKGYKQRVGLAQALIGDPELLILDEPTVGLDPSQIMEIRDVIRLVGKRKTVILSTHILQEVTAVCDKVIIIHHGKIMVCDTLSNLESGGKHTYRVSVKADPQNAEKVFSQNNITAVAAESTEEGISSFDIDAGEDESVRESVFNAFAAAGLPIVELRETSMSIEDVFREYTDDDLIREREMKLAEDQQSDETEDAAEDSAAFQEANGDSDETAVKEDEQ